MSQIQIHDGQVERLAFRQQECLSAIRGFQQREPIFRQREPDPGPRTDIIFDQEDGEWTCAGRGRGWSFIGR